MPLASSMYKWNGLVMSGRARARVDTPKALRALCSVLVQSKGCMLPVLAQKDLAVIIKLLSLASSTQLPLGIPVFMYVCLFVFDKESGCAGWFCVT